MCVDFITNIPELYIKFTTDFIKRIARYLYHYFSLDYVFANFFMPYKKVDNIAGWFVGIVFKLIYIIFVVPIFLLIILGLVIFWYLLPLAVFIIGVKLMH